MIVLRNSLKLYMHVYVITVGKAIGLYVFFICIDDCITLFLYFDPCW